MEYLFLKANTNHFMFKNLPKFQEVHQSGHEILTCDNPVVPLEYTTEAKIFSSICKFNVGAINGSYMFRPLSSIQAVYVRSITGNFIPAPYR